jgi:hypothetical protein
LNDKGQSAVALDDGRSGIYQHGSFTPLPPPPPGYSFQDFGGPTGINNDGTIAGGIENMSDGFEYGFVLSHGHYEIFNRPGWDNTEARAIANSGLVAGYSAAADGSTGSFIYDPATGAFTDATPPGAVTNTFSTAQGMNKHGRIVGDTRLPGLGRFAFVWQQNAVKTRSGTILPFLTRTKVNGGNSAGRGINDDGLITGFVNPGIGFVGNDVVGYTLLIPPGGNPDDGNSTACEGINNRGQVVCSTSDGNGPTGAYIATPRDDD